MGHAGHGSVLWRVAKCDPLSAVVHINIRRKTISKRYVQTVFVDATSNVAVTILSQHCRRKYYAYLKQRVSGIQLKRDASDAPDIARRWPANLCHQNTTSVSIGFIVSNNFWATFVKRFALCYRTAVCPVLSVTLVYCGQTVGWIKMKLGLQVGLGHGHIVLDGNPAPLPNLPPKGHSPQFSAHICSGQMAGWIKTPLGRKVGLDPSDIVLSCGSMLK